MADAPPLRRGRAASSTNRNPFELFAELCAHFNFGKPIFKLIKSHNNNPPKTIQMGLTVIKLGISGNTKFLPCHYDKILILFFFFVVFVFFNKGNDTSTSSEKDPSEYSCAQYYKYWNENDLDADDEGDEGELILYLHL
jgi:hypothetical protein